MKDQLPAIGRNIRYLRRQNGWTLSGLAEKIKICEGPLGRIERGLNAPSAIVIYRLARVFGVQIDTLFAEKTQDIGFVKQVRMPRGCYPVIVHGETRILPAGIREMAHELTESFQALEDICKVQKRSQIPLHIPFELNELGIEALSITIRRLMGIGHGIVFDYFELFETHGFRVISAPMPRDCEGFSCYDSPNQNVFYFLNSRQNPERQLFRLAWELGKVLILTQSMMQTFTDEKPNMDKEKQILSDEKAARYFAAVFLMPEKAVRDTVQQLGIRNKCWSYDLILRIKNRFGISAQSFLYRLEELDLIEPESSRHFETIIQEHYQKTKKGEPGLSKRRLSSNGRFWDLVYSGKDIDNKRDEVLEIEQVMRKWKIPGS